MSLKHLREFLRTHKEKAGMAPGVLVGMTSVQGMAAQASEIPQLTVIEYDGEHLVEREIREAQECRELLDTDRKTWINLSGLQDIGLLNALGEDFNIHPLVLEDILNTHQRPKVDEFENGIFIVLQMLDLAPAEKPDPSAGSPLEIKKEQISIVLQRDVLLTFQEHPGDVFNPVRERLHHNKSRVRSAGTDYLAYALMDVVVDAYFKILEAFGEHLEELGERIIAKPTPERLEEIHSMKADLMYLRRSIWPLREVAGTLQEGDSGLITDETRLFFRDLHDHIVQVIDTIEQYRETQASMLDTYMTSINFQINHQMRILSIFAAIFMPLTFIVGIYGMNFDYMPELRWPAGYPAVMGLMGLITVGMLIFFKRRKWF